MFTFKIKYFCLAIALLLIEIFIALFVHDNFIRPYAGDFLVVILIYCFVKSFFNIPVYTLALSVLLFACLIEMFQYFKLVNHLGLQKSSSAKILMGTSFEWKDILAYVLGILLVVTIEKLLVKKHPADFNTK